MNPTKWYRDPGLWVELFALVNLAGLAPDIFLAHSTNFFHQESEYIPLVFSLAAPLALIPTVIFYVKSRPRPWRILGGIVGWCAVGIGIAGLVLHLESQFFQRWTLASLVYAAPFAAPLAYTGIGLLLIMNRMVDATTTEWAQWVIFLALGGFVGNFVFSVTDHAQNGFYHITEWIPVASSGLAVGFLIVPLMMSVNRGYLRVCGFVLAIQAAVGVTGFFLHGLADLHRPGATLFDRAVYGAPIFAPMLFPDLVLLSLIGVWVLYLKLPAETAGEAALPGRTAT